MRLLSIYTAAMLCIIFGSTQGWAQQPTAIPVGTVAAELRPITKATEFVGRVEAMERVDIRARVTGFLQEILFKDGDFVKEGDVLYRIERETFDAAVQQARGALLEAQGKYANATAQRARTEELTKTSAAPLAQLDERLGGGEGRARPSGRCGCRPEDCNGKPWLHRYRGPDQRADRPIQTHQRECRWTRQWRPDHDC